jgi:hypothetical protein
MILTTKENEMSNENTELNNTSTCRPSTSNAMAMLHIQQDFERANSNEYSKEKDMLFCRTFTHHAHQLTIRCDAALAALAAIEERVSRVNHESDPLYGVEGYMINRDATLLLHKEYSTQANELWELQCKLQETFGEKSGEAMSRIIANNY